MTARRNTSSSYPPGARASCRNVPVSTTLDSEVVTPGNVDAQILQLVVDPLETSMSNPETVSIMQTGGTVRFTDPTGQTQEVTLSAGEPVLLPATVHTTQNVGDTELLGVLVELKY